MRGVSVAHTNVHTVKNDTIIECDDLLAIEEPLEMRIGYGPEHNRQEFPLAVTMRTPGHDKELTIGFLRSESIIGKIDDIISAKHCVSDPNTYNVFRVELSYDTCFEKEQLTRNFFTSSSCGLCGKATIDAITRVIIRKPNPVLDINKSTIHQLAHILGTSQSIFKHTGSIHATGIFYATGELLFSTEDVGRHNAMDKAIGRALIENISLEDKLMMLSGRIGFELVQKALIAGCRAIAAIGAPTSLAVELANEHDMLLIGFAKNNKYNIYSGISYLTE